MNNSTTDIPSKTPAVTWTRVAVVYTYIVYPLIVVTATIGNGLVCLVIYKRYKRNALKNYYVFLLNLAISDMIFAWVTIASDLPLQIDYSKWPYTDALCPILYMLQNTAYYTSIFTLAVISLVRYQGILYPLKHALSNQRAVIVSLGLWIVSGAARLPEALTFRVVGDSCGSYWPPSTYQLAIILYSIFTFAVPFAVTLISYIIIGRHLKSRVVLNDPTSNLKRINSNKQVIKMLVVGASVFAACVIPLHITLFLLVFGNVGETEMFWDFFIICQGIACCHCMVNPICYTLSNAGFRKEVYQAVACVRTAELQGSRRTFLQSSKRNNHRLSEIPIQQIDSRLTSV